VPQEDVENLVNGFIKLFELSPTKKSDFDFDANIPYFIQESANETLGYDRTKPYFIAPISSATSKNISALKNALFNLVQADRD